MQFVSTLYVYLLQLMRIFAGIIIFTMFALICIDVFMRMAGLQPWLYVSIIVEYGLLWFTMMAAPWLARTKGHVFIDAIAQLLPKAVSKVTSRISYIVCILACGTFAYYSYELLMIAIEDNLIDTRAVDVPQWALLAPLPLCFTLLALEFVRFLLGFDTMYGERTDVKDNV